MLSLIQHLKDLNAEIFSCFLHIEYKENIYLFEKRLHVQKNKYMRAMLKCRHQANVSQEFLNQLDKLYDIMLDGALLRRRVSDYTTFGICTDEYKAMLQAMDDAFAALCDARVSGWTNTQLEKCIKAIEDNYHTIVQITAREPLVFLLFIASLKAWSREMGVLVEMACQSNLSSRAASSTGPSAFHAIKPKSLGPALKAARDDIKVGLCILTAIFLNYFCSFSHEYWLVYTAALISFFGMNAPIRKSMLIFVVMLLVAIIVPTFTASILQARLLDVGLGAILGMVFNHVLFPVNFAKKFNQGIAPVLQATQHYADLLAKAFIQQDIPAIDLQVAKQALQEALLSPDAQYPEWVYALGFNPRLRAGFRFFLVNIERIMEILFSMDYWVTCKVDPLLVQDLAGRIKDTAEKNHELFTILLAYFRQNEFLEITADFTADMVALEEALTRVLPAELELLDISPDYLVLTAFVRDIKDIRELLLQLVMALPSEKRA